MSTIDDVISNSTIPAAERQVIVNALVQREDEMATRLRMAGMQFGLYPEIVAEVLAEVGMGTALSEEERTLIREQFVELMRRLQAGQGG